MKIKTLEFIHRLLIDKADQTNRDYLSLLPKAREIEESCDTITDEEEQFLDSYSDCVAASAAAAYALKDFENNDW